MVIIEQLLTKQEVAEYRSKLNHLPWSDGSETAMGMASLVKNNSQADASNRGVQDLANLLLARIGETPTIISAALPHKIFPPCFNRYCENETYGFHVDAAIMRVPRTNEVLRSDVSMTVFLSEPDEYEGGELVIATEFGEQRVKLAAGQAVVYPSSSLHKVTPVTQGQRVAAITWMQSMVADQTIRQNLYQLDKNIQSLIQSENTPRQELDGLHNVYHNLVRSFSHI